MPEAKDWTFLAVGDFNGDGKPDVALLSYGMKRAAPVGVLQHGQRRPAVRGRAGRHASTWPEPDPKKDHPLLRDAPVVADWNGDGIDDLIIGKGQDNQVLVLLGGHEGLELGRSVTGAAGLSPPLRDGPVRRRFRRRRLPDLACLGYTNTGVGSSGPLAVYVRRVVQKP